eukprot:Opistho-2@35765
MGFLVEYSSSEISASGETESSDAWIDDTLTALCVHVCLCVRVCVRVCVTGNKKDTETRHTFLSMAASPLPIAPRAQGVTPLTSKCRCQRGASVAHRRNPGPR